MTLPEKFYRFAQMQAPGALKSKVGCIKGKQDGTKLGKGMNAEDECHEFRPPETFIFRVKTILINCTFIH
jgi:hypothetical protein